MKNCTIFLLIAFCLKLSYCLGQAEVKLNDKDGMVLSYKKGKYFGERYDEYCKTTFDIYKVVGIVENKNQDKAAFVVAVLGFEGKTCNKIYNDNGPSGGEIIDKIYTLDIPGQTTHKSQYWVNKVVHLLPGDKMEATGYVEVKKGEPCPDAESNPYFTYELFSGANNNETANSEKVPANSIVEQPESKKVSYSELIVGKWTRIHLMNTSGVDDDLSEPGYYDEYRANGQLIHANAVENDESWDYHWSINGNIINMKSVYGPSHNEILFLDDNKLAIKTDWGNGKYAVETYKRVKDKPGKKAR
ncbi:hypothetical protein I6I99_09745 [Sphingobacterium multivorum]|nr:hypothetical protein [Sphingobacterium multivorum]QQT32815.1 hypothetical protein I6I99_09745 [Sphingobacterium multivorum]